MPIVEAEIQNGTADPITDDIHGLVRTLAATTAFTLSGESAFLGPGRDVDAAVQILEKLWLQVAVGRTDRRLSRRYRDRQAQLRGQEGDSSPARPAGSAGPPHFAWLARALSSTSPTSTPKGWSRPSPMPAHWAPPCLNTAHWTSPTTTRWRAFAADIHTRHPAMDIVMNIAGISAWGTVEHLTHRHWRSMIDVNLMGPIHVIETFLPPMVAAGRGGQLVNVSSAAGLVALPWHAAYSASKFGLRGLSEVLRFDLARHDIGVSVVVPGAVNTPLVDTVHIAGVDRDHPKVQRLVGPVQRARRVGRRRSPTGSWRASPRTDS